MLVKLYQRTRLWTKNPYPEWWRQVERFSTGNMEIVWTLGRIGKEYILFKDVYFV